MSERIRRGLCMLLRAIPVAVLAVLAWATPASAQQLVDASEDGDVAFILFTLMCVAFVGGLFLMDRVRRRRMDEDEVERQ